MTSKNNKDRIEQEAAEQKLMLEVTVETLEDIQGKLVELLQEARDAVRGLGLIERRAQSYWLHQLAVLADEHEASYNATGTIGDTIFEIVQELEGADNA